MEKKRITDIHCPNCGAPAKFDIIRQRYMCGYCGGSVGISEALQQKQGFRKLQGGRIRNSVKQFRLFHASCSGCGAEIVFEENEALSGCPFCGRSLVRTEYLKTTDMPESVIPFAVTEDEAKGLLKKWCSANPGKPEARQLPKLTGELKGFYLPYEMVRGPVHMTVSRMDSSRTYFCQGFVNDEFVNCSSQLDNLLLDGMEPYDLDALTEFDFGYVAGHRVKISDISDKELTSRVKEETEEVYTPAVRKVLESKAVELSANVSSAIRLPVLLPVYYLREGDLMAAVNGQTGKVSVRAQKESHYYFLPWWLKAILATLAFTAVTGCAMYAFGMNAGSSLIISGMLAIFYLIVTLCYFSDTVRNSFSVVSGREIYTSGEKNLVRDEGTLVFSDRMLERKVVSPVFFENLDGTAKPVELRFITPRRVLRIALLCIVALFLPVILALFLNGFDFQRLTLGGSAVWFCIAVPVVPIYLLKFGIVELHDNPWIFIRTDKGKKKRYRQKHKIRITWNGVKEVLRVLFVPPVSLAVWFGILCFFMCVYLTAFGFE